MKKKETEKKEKPIFIQSWRVRIPQASWIFEEIYDAKRKVKDLMDGGVNQIVLEKK